MGLIENIVQFKTQFDGEIFTDQVTRLLYSTDASPYREEPVAVVIPKSKNDIQKIILFARENNTSVIPRGAGTSLAGQVVGSGIVVDISKYLNKIIELNIEERWVRVEPGVVLDELNQFLKPYGLFFGPETSTSNRCTIGGMLGNNACGAHSILYGSSRDHILEIKSYLSDASEIIFKSVSIEELHSKCQENTLEGQIYKNIKDILSDPFNQKEIKEQYPDPAIKRRNTGYALDLLLETEVFTSSPDKFNLSKLLAGSEGTLAFTTEVKLNLVTLPPPVKGLICAHFNNKAEAFKANLIALKYHPGAVEMIDHNVLELTKNNIEQSKNRFFVQGEPDSILIIEFARNSKEEIQNIAIELEKSFKDAGLGYHFPLILDNDINKVWSLRKAGLGLLTNMIGDSKPVSLIEDTAVNVEQLPEYLADFEQILSKYDKKCVYHAHIGSGELHLRPILNLKNEKDVELFHSIGQEIAHLVKKYHGSLSGEHGDGRLRGEFIPIMLGNRVYNLLKSVKKTWDPENIFNPGKIIDTPPMNESLRYIPGRSVKEIKTIFDFYNDGGILRSIERCNGSADCRKSDLIGGVMCPSYMISRKEHLTTRARANILREFISNSSNVNVFDHKEIYNILDLCLSCKGCKSECPSSVDMAKLKAEFLQHYYDTNGIPLRTRAIAYISKLNAFGSLMPELMNFLLSGRISSAIIKRVLDFEQKRNIPPLSEITLEKWNKKRREKQKQIEPIKGKVYLFCDEFTNFNESEIGIKTILLLTKLGYEVIIPEHLESGRTYISKGLIRTAKKIAIKNINSLKNIVSYEIPLVGVEPSAILTFRDEYTDLVPTELKKAALEIAKNTFLIEEFLAKEIDAGKIEKNVFTTTEKKILLHGHCQQKSIASTLSTKKVLSYPINYKVEEIPTGCCGMAGSFGFEKEHYALSMQIGEMILFPAIRNVNEEVIIAAPGTSCRQQIKDGTGRKAFHPIEILYEALND